MPSLYPDIRLLSITPGLLGDLELPAVEFWTSYRARLGDVADRVRELVRQTLEIPGEGFLVVEARLDQVVGICGFKGGGEIAYGIFPPFEGKGYATAAVAALRARSGGRPLVAHTLPEANASTRVLQKNGFTLSGEVVDPDDGPVWRWEARTSD